MKKISIFTKFTLLIVAGAVLIVVATHAALFINFRKMRNTLPFAENFHRLTNLIISQINTTDTVETRQFIEQYGFDLRYQRNDFEWTSSPDMPTFADALEKGKNHPIYWQGKRLISIIEKGDGIYILRGTGPFEHMEFPVKAFLMWLGMLVLIFGITHCIIGRLLRPVRILQHGVRQVSTGKFDVRLARTTSDELGELVESFNHMALQISNDMKSRDQLLRDISHEFRSPLARMLLALEFVPEGAIRQTFRRNIAALEKMTGSILEDERLDSPFGKIKRMPIDITRLVGDIIETKKHGPVTIRLNVDGTYIVDADEERMRMALTNIIDNAVNYSRLDNADATVAIACTQDNAWVVLTIKDTGIGIPEADLPFVFEPFYRVDKARRHRSGGFGLGLHLTKKIIDAHGGTITIESTMETGTLVTIRLPVVEGKYHG